MDDETAEIELLQQNLAKTRQLSKRMTSILDTFETRINKLEQSIRPLHNAAQLLNRRRNNIDRTLRQITEVSGGNEADLRGEENVVLRGPQPGQLHLYRDALDRLNANLAFKGGVGGEEVAHIAGLVEMGAQKLTQLYTKVVAEGSSGPITPAGSTNEVPITTFPASLLPSLSPVVKFLRTLPLPTTHPNHPAAKEIARLLSEAQKGYAEMRGQWCVKCIDGQGKRLIARANEVDPLVTGREFGEWVELLLGCAEEEYKLLLELSPLPSSSSLAGSFGVLMSPIMRLFANILNSLITLSKKNLQRYSFLALSAYEALLGLQVHWEEVLSKANSALREKNEFKDGLVQLRSLCLRSFPEFLVDLKMGANPRNESDIATKIHPLTRETVKYLAKIPEVREAVTSALVVLGDGNWKMGEGVMVGVKKPPNAGIGEGEEGLVLEHFLHDVVQTAIASLTNISRVARRPAFGSIFLLNNITYLRGQVLDTIGGLLGTSTRDFLTSSARTSKATYFDANFSPLMQALADEGGKGTMKKDLVKEKFTRFYDLFDEVMERHRMVLIFADWADSGGLDERESLGEEVVRMIVPSLTRFVQKQKDRDFSKNPGKYIKQKPDELEAQIRNVFGASG